MRNLIIAFLSFWGLISCTLDDNSNQGLDLDLVPILDVELPEELKKDSIYEISVQYLRPSNCHSFRGYDYNYNGNERIVAVVNNVIRSTECKTLENDTVTSSLRLRVVQDGFYLFKFWQGKNTNGENQFLTREIPVVTSL